MSYRGNQSETENCDFSTKNEARQSTRSKFLKILRRHDSKRRSKRALRNTEAANQDTNKVKFQDHEEGEIREVTLKIDQENRKLGRRATLVETILGLTVGTLTDGRRVMIAGFIPDSEATKQKNIKIGDWLKSLNNIELTYQNLNNVLEQVCVENEVVLKLQRVAGVEVTRNPPINELCNQSDFVQQLTNAKADDANALSAILCELLVGIICIDTESLTETGPEFEGVIYCYPYPLEKNILCSTRGIFITLNHLLHEVTQTKPVISTIFYNKQLAYIVYSRFSNKLILLMLPENRSSINEAILINNEIIRMLQFMYQTIDKCFENPAYKDQLNHFFSMFFARLLSNGVWSSSDQNGDLANLKIKSQESIPPQFEELLPAARLITLSDDAQMQIDDALTELEASDYREWVPN